jgi:hypothetical protein
MPFLPGKTYLAPKRKRRKFYGKSSKTWVMPETKTHTIHLGKNAFFPSDGTALVAQDGNIVAAGNTPPTAAGYQTRFKKASTVGAGVNGAAASDQYPQHIQIGSRQISNFFAADGSTEGGYTMILRPDRGVDQDKFIGARFTTTSIYARFSLFTTTGDALNTTSTEKVWSQEVIGRVLLVLEPIACPWEDGNAQVKHYIDARTRS